PSPASASAVSSIEREPDLKIGAYGRRQITAKSGGCGYRKPIIGIFRSRINFIQHRCNAKAAGRFERQSRDEIDAVRIAEDRPGIENEIGHFAGRFPVDVLPYDQGRDLIAEAEALAEIDIDPDGETNGGGCLKFGGRGIFIDGHPGY